MWQHSCIDNHVLAGRCSDAADVCGNLSLAQAAARCPSQCNAELGWDSGWEACRPHTPEAQHTDIAQPASHVHFRRASPGDSCKCKFGQWGKDCSFQMSTVYFSKEVYSGLICSHWIYKAGDPICLKL
ncbi:hypothetical protein ABBQ38_000719 [Trebouxia sp. C0009 RCD-2024]